MSRPAQPQLSPVLGRAVPAAPTRLHPEPRDAALLGNGTVNVIGLDELPATRTGVPSRKRRSGAGHGGGGDGSRRVGRAPPLPAPPESTWPADAVVLGFCLQTPELMTLSRFKLSPSPGTASLHLPLPCAPGRLSTCPARALWEGVRSRPSAAACGGPPLGPGLGSVHPDPGTEGHGGGHSVHSRP